MNGFHSSDYSYLDKIRIDEGTEKCKSDFVSITKKDTKRAVTLLNDNRLMFPSLYILHEPILQNRIQSYLNTRNITALRIANQIKGVQGSGTDYLSSTNNSIYPTLKWIWETGSIEEISEDNYEEILDVTVSVLINRYKEIDILPLLVDLIFKRNRKGSNIHDLVWSLFRYHDPQVLKLIAEHLKSSNQEDAALAAELLNTDQTDVRVPDGNGERQYEGYINWMEENKPYLYFTGESFQYASKPVFCTLDLERKYLQKGTSSYDKQPISSLEDEEIKCVKAFKQLSVEEQKALSGYSQKISGKSVQAWKEWIHAPIEEQIKTAKAGKGGKE